jgi:ATP-dependent helicase YprA (DUF1998 family)
VVLSNPDMVHSGILPHHPRWAKLFENLRFVVIDELHAYRGVFGSHLTNVLRRLRRLCRHYGSNPTFICSSATIAIPARARGIAGRAAFRARVRNRARRAARKCSCSSTRRSSPAARHPPVVSGGNAAHRGGVPQAQAAADRLRAEPAHAQRFLTTYLKDDFAGQPGRRD